MRRIILILGLVVALFNSVHARPLLTDVTGLRCSFQSRVVAESPLEWELDSGEGWRVGTRPELDVGQDEKPMEIFIDSIDRGSRHARMIGNVGSTDVRVLDKHTVLYIAEARSGGAFHIMAVFERYKSDKNPPVAFPATYTRHTVMYQGSFVVSQFYGECKPEPWGPFE